MRSGGLWVVSQKWFLLIPKRYAYVVFDRKTDQEINKQKRGKFYSIKLWVQMKYFILFCENFVEVSE